MSNEDHGAALLDEIDGSLFLCETAEQNSEEQKRLRVHAEALIAENNKLRDALREAAEILNIADDWNFHEVEIDGNRRQVGEVAAEFRELARKS